MKTESSDRVLKQSYRRVMDLVDYIGNLRNSMDGFVAGQQREFKTLLSTLRVLLINRHAKDDGLLLAIARLNGQVVHVSVQGLQGVPKTNPLSNDRTMSFESYLKESAIAIVEGRTFTVKDFVWELASQEGSHSDEGLAYEFAVGENFLFNDIDANVVTILGISRTVLSAGCSLLKAIRPLILAEDLARLDFALGYKN